MDSAIIWFIVGAALILSEFALPGIILVFFGVAAWIIALLDWLGLVETLPVQLILYPILSLALIIGLRRLFMRSFTGLSRDSATGDTVMDEFLGHEVEVLENFDAAGAEGKVEFKGATWNAISDNAFAEGDKAVIASRDGLKLNITKKG